jgi:hypothetical protein
MQMGIFNEYTMLNYLNIEVANPPAANLRVTQGITNTTTLTADLQWSPPATAMTQTLRYGNAPITEANWDAATLLAGSLPGSQNSYTAGVPYTGGTVYFAIKTQNAQGEWSALSNNAFWPHRDVFLPVVIK